ncbi:MAG: arginine repressor [Pseudomonadota bacterium]|nr:arginine repressor [Pseudomonadota bacterium]
MTKHQRQRMIADWLRELHVGSQEELVARLSLAGITATQATVSRDLLELGAVKLKREGTIRYVMPDQVEPGHAAAKLDRLLAEWVDAIMPAGNILVLKTPPGSANLVANALDAAGLEEVAGTIAGDDTIFVALADGTNPHAVVKMLQQRRAGA